MAVNETMPEWSTDIQNMDIKDVLEKWPFLATIKGLELAYMAKNALKSIEHLSKRFKRLADKCQETSVTGVLNFVLQKSGDIGPLVFDV